MYCEYASQLPSLAVSDDEQPARNSDDSATAETTASARLAIKLITSLLGFGTHMHPKDNLMEGFMKCDTVLATFDNDLDKAWLLTQFGN
jgi:hypothetical protein